MFDKSRYLTHVFLDVQYELGGWTESFTRFQTNVCLIKLGVGNNDGDMTWRPAFLF